MRFSEPFIQNIRDEAECRRYCDFTYVGISDMDDMTEEDGGPARNIILEKQGQFLSQLSSKLSSIELNKIPNEFERFTKFLRTGGIDISDTTGDDPWDSLVACFLQHAAQDFTQDGIDELLALDKKDATQLEIQIQRSKRLAGNPGTDKIVQGLNGSNAEMQDRVQEILGIINTAFKTHLEIILFDGNQNSLDKIQSLAPQPDDQNQNEKETGDVALNGNEKDTTQEGYSTVTLENGEKKQYPNQDGTQGENDSDLAQNIGDVQGEVDAPVGITMDIKSSDNTKDKTKVEETQAQSHESKEVEKVAEKQPQFIILWYDSANNLFRNLFLRELLFESVDDFCDALFGDLIENEELVPYHLRSMQDIEMLDLMAYIQSKLDALTKIGSVASLLTDLMPDASPEEQHTLQILSGYEPQLNPENVSSSLIFRSKKQFIFSMKKSCDLILQRREADHRDKLRDMIDAEEDMIREGDRLSEEQKAAEAEKSKREQEIAELEKLLQQKHGDKTQLLALIETKKAELAQTAQNLQIALGKVDWTQFKKNLMLVEPSYDNLQRNTTISEFDRITNLQSLVQHINTIYTNIPKPLNPTPFWNYVNANNTQANRDDLLSTLRTALLGTPRFAPNKSDMEILEVTGRQIVTSQIMDRLASSNFREVRIAAGSIVYVDSNFEQSRWHGKNVVITAPTVDIRKHVTINTSGYSAPVTFPPKAESPKTATVLWFYDPAAGRSGMDGQDGAPGESAGHVLIQADTIRHGSNLTIISNGGAGAPGQSGEDGRAGRDGRGGNNPTFGKPEKGERGYKEGVRYEAGTPGESGQSGGNGGRAGLGGGGGHKGDIVISTKAPTAQTQAAVGNTGGDGSNGKGARGGQGGVNGVDLLWIYDGHSWTGKWIHYRGGNITYRQTRPKGWDEFWEWDVRMTRTEQEVRSSRARDGQHGQNGQTASQRSHQRRTAGAKQSINSNEVSILSSAVRNMYSTSHQVEHDVSMSQHAKTQLEQRQKTLQQEKETAARNVKRLEEEIKAAEESKTQAEQAKAQLEQLIKENLEQQGQVEASLRQMEASRKEFEKSTLLETSAGVGKQIEQMFQRHQHSSKQQMQRRSQLQQETSLVRDFEADGDKTLITLKQEEYLTTQETKMESLYDEVRLVQNVDKLSDEFFAIAIAARAKDTAQAEAFELGLQAITSFSTGNTLPLYIRQHLDSRSKQLSSANDSNSILPVKYLRDHLPEDVKIVLQTQEWVERHPLMKQKIFRTIDYFGDFLGEFLFLLRQHDAFSFKKKIAQVHLTMEEVKKEVPLQSKGHLLIDHVTKIVFQHMEDWFVTQCRKHPLIGDKPEAQGKLRTFATFIDNLYTLVKVVVPSLELLRTYEVCLEEVNNPEFLEKTSADLFWERVVLVLTQIGGKREVNGFESVLKQLTTIRGLLSANKTAKTRDKMEKLNILPRLILLSDYLNLSSVQIQILLGETELIYAAASGQHLKRIYDQLAQLTRSFYTKYIQKFQIPAVSKIGDFIEAIYDRKQKKELKVEVDTIIRNIIESPTSPLKLSDRISFYQRLTKGLKTIINASATKPMAEFRAVVQDIKSQVITFSIPPAQFELQELIEAFSPKNQEQSSFAINFSTALNILTKKLQMSKNKPGTEMCKMSPEFLVSLLSWFKSCTMGLSLLKKVSREELASVNNAVGDFCIRNLELSSYDHFIIADQLRYLHNVLAKKWTLCLFSKLKAAEELEVKEKTSLYQNKTEILKFIKNFLEISDEIVAASDIVECVELHLDKIIIGLGDQLKNTEDILETLSSFYADLQKCQEGGTTPVQFLITMTNILNNVTRQALNIKVPIDSEAIQSPLLKLAIPNYNTNPWHINSLANLVRSLTSCLEWPSEFAQVSSLLHHLNNSFVLMQTINYKNYQPVDQNHEHESLCTVLATMFEDIADSVEKHSKQLPEPLLEQLSNLQMLIQSVAEKDIHIFKQVLGDKRKTMDDAFFKQFSHFKDRILSDLDELLDTYFQSGDSVLTFAAVVELFVTTLEQKIIPFMSRLGLGLRRQIGVDIEDQLYSLYFECFLKYFNLQAIPTMPSELRAAIFHLQVPKKSTYNNQLTLVFTTLLKLVQEGGLQNIFSWLLPSLVILVKLLNAMPDKNLTCSELHNVHILATKLHSLITQLGQGQLNLKQVQTSLDNLERINTTLVQFAKDVLTSNAKDIPKDRRDQLDSVLVKGEQLAWAISSSVIISLGFQSQLFSTLEAATISNSSFESSLTQLVQKTLNTDFQKDLPPVTSPECIEAIAAQNDGQKWSKILGLVVLSLDINSKEKSFFQRILFNTNQITWVPSKEQEEAFLQVVKARYTSNKSSQGQDEDDNGCNQFLEIVLGDLQLSQGVGLSILHPTEQAYLDHILTHNHQAEYESVGKELKNLLVSNSVPQWHSELRDFALSKVFIKFVQLYQPAFEDIHHKAEELISPSSYTKLLQESSEFLSSHVENLRNREAFQLASESLVINVHTTPTDPNKPDNILPSLKYFVEQLITLKYFFNRSLFFAYQEGSESLWFTWMNLLHQRCTLRKPPLQEFNKILQRSVDLPVRKLVNLVTQTSLQNWMDVMYFQIAIENYTAFLECKQDMVRNLKIDFEQQVKQLTTRLTSLIGEQGSKRFLLIFGDKILQEAQLAGLGATVVEPEIVLKVLEELAQVTPLSDALLDKLEHQGLSQWSVSTREHILLAKWPHKLASSILKMELQVGQALCTQFLSSFVTQFPIYHFESGLIKMNGQNDTGTLEKFVSNFTSSRWVLDEIILSKINQESDAKSTLADWEHFFSNYSTEVNSRFRDEKELIRLMREDEKNSSIMHLLKANSASKLETEVKEILQTLYHTSKMDLRNSTPIGEWTSQQISIWAATTHSLPEHERRDRISDNKIETLAVLCQGLRVFTSKYSEDGTTVEKPGFLPRDTQLMSVILLLDAFYSRKGRLAEISTGEGKTFIVAMMATYRALAGDDVDVITSSPILAEENAKEVKGYYEMFGISVANNCDKTCEQEEEARKARYHSQVIYGDVGSFQRDILLTTFFHKGITMNRTPETVVIDEVDSMLLDKGENILYLSHSIPDLKFLWPLFIEIWQATHAPDVCQGRSKDISMVVCFLRERIRSQEIFFPNRLTTFIQQRLPIWVKNAFVAENLMENDPYILADVDKKGTKVVIVDKDTGVEQVQMHWSNGLHQFLQLKHGDKLSSESLKAVFMSNIGYFQQFKGRLYGITGTLGSLAERDLLTQCYGVDFFSMPRFKARRCYEEPGVVGVDEKTWLELVTTEVIKKTKEESRAILIICENVVSVDKIGEELKKVIFPSRIYFYKSSFDEEFHKKNKATPLTSGDVIVATNLAGRGTDLKTSKELESFGGLHVILSYMTANVRIEEQAFGRTARAGLSGTVQFIIQHPNDQVGIDELRQQRNFRESERLEIFRTRSMQRIEIEEILCNRFTSLYDKVSRSLGNSGANSEFKEMQLEFVKNQWALWLDSMSEKIKILHITGKTPIFQAFNTFEQNMLNKLQYATGAIELTKLGRHYENEEQYSQAINIFDMAISLEPNYSEIAHYYKAACIIKETDSGLHSKKRAVHHLKLSDKIIRKRIAQLMTASQTLEATEGLRRERGVGTASGRFAKQVKHESELFQVHVGKIDEAIGHVVDGKFFAGVTGVLDEAEGEAIFNILRRNYDVLKNFRMSKKVDLKADKIYVRQKTGENLEVELPPMFNYCKSEIISHLRSKVHFDGRQRVIEPEGFSHLVQTQESFWNLLRQLNFFEQEKSEVVQVVTSKEEVLDAIHWPQSLVDYASSIKKIVMGRNTQVFTQDCLDPLDLDDGGKETLIQMLNSNGLLTSKNSYKAHLSPEIKSKIKWSSTKGRYEGFPSALIPYQDIIETMLEADKEDYTDPNSTPEFKEELSMVEVPLPDTAEFGSRQIWGVLNEAGAIKDCRVNFSINLADSQSKIDDRLDDIEKAIKKDSGIKETFKKFHKAGEAPEIADIMETITKSIGTIKTFPCIEIEYQALEDYFMTGEYPPEIEDFRYMVFLQVLECTEKKSWWDWDAFIVAMLGVAQIVAGVLLEVFTAGAATYIATALISEGIGDIGFAIEAGINKNFSWKAYKDYKIMSLAITIVTAGVGAWMSRGAQVAKFAGKVGFQLFKAVALRVLKKCVTAVVFKLADIGIDKLLEHIKEEAIKNCSSQLKALFTSDPNIQSQFKRLDAQMDLIYQHSYEPGQAEKIIQDGLRRVLRDMQGEGLGVRMNDIASKVTSGVAGAISKASGKLTSHGKQIGDNLNFEGGSGVLSKAAKLAKIGAVLAKIIKGAELAKQLIELVSIAPEVLIRLIKHLEIRVIDLKNGRSGKPHLRSDAAVFSKFKTEFISSTKTELVDMLLSKINSGLVAPAFQDLAQSALRKAGKAMEKNTKALLHSLRTPKEEEIKILKTLRRKEALNEQQIVNKLRGKIDLDEVDPSTPIKNSDGKTLGQLRECYGDALTVYTDQSGKFHVERPSFEQSLKAFGQGRKAGFYELLICANYYKQSVEISDFSGELESTSDDGKVRIHPKGEADKNNPPLRVAFVKGENGYGYFAPMVDDKIIPMTRDNKNTINTNLYQTLDLLNKAKVSNLKPGDDGWDALVLEVAKDSSVQKSINNISNYALNSKTARFLYDAGAYEVGNKLWERSSPTRVLTKVESTRRLVSSLGDDGGGTDQGPRKETDSTTEEGDGWRGKSVEVVKIGDDYITRDTAFTTRATSFVLPSTVNEAISAHVNLWAEQPFRHGSSINYEDGRFVFRQSSGVNFDDARLDRAVNLYLGADQGHAAPGKYSGSGVKSGNTDKYPEFEDLSGFPVALVTARMLMDETKSKEYNLHGFKLTSSPGQHVPERRRTNTLQLMEFDYHKAPSFMEFAYHDSYTF